MRRGLKYHGHRMRSVLHLVAPFTGAWIEISSRSRPWWIREVAPFTGAWIEIEEYDEDNRTFYESLPSRERGLKSLPAPAGSRLMHVAPFTGAWIEICRSATSAPCRSVAPFTGAWIEIRTCSCSAPTRRVAPFTGAWIEIFGVY